MENELSDLQLLAAVEEMEKYIQELSPSPPAPLVFWRRIVWWGTEAIGWNYRRKYVATLDLSRRRRLFQWAASVVVDIWNRRRRFEVMYRLFTTAAPASVTNDADRIWRYRHHHQQQHTEQWHDRRWVEFRESKHRQLLWRRTQLRGAAGVHWLCNLHPVTCPMPCFHIVLNDDFLFHSYNCHVIVDVCVCVCD